MKLKIILKMKKMIQKIKVILNEIWLGFSISNYIQQNHQQFGKL